MIGAGGSRGPTRAQVDRFALTLAALAPEGPLALAVSGGPDSLALLLLARAARPGAIHAATVDHGLRREAADEARFVARLCRRLDVPHETLRVEVDAAGGPQAAARAARYAALERWAGAAGATALATAHHLDDQAETVLLRLARGAGVAGLAGVRPVRRLASGLALVRPLLGWRRDELGAIVAAAGVIPVDDPSNRDPRYDRTRARTLLKAGWPEAARLAAVAGYLADAEEALGWAADREYGQRAAPDGAAMTLDPRDLPDELLRRLVARLLRAIEGADVPIAGPDLTRLIERLRAGEAATLGTVKATPGERWRFERAPARRNG